MIANVQRAARERIDRDLPPDASPEGDDAMRKRVEELVDNVGSDFERSSDEILIGSK